MSEGLIAKWLDDRHSLDEAEAAELLRVLTGDPELVGRTRKNPLFRALRVDKLVVKGLEETLKRLVFARYDEIPALRMLRMSADVVRARAERLRGHAPGWSHRRARSLRQTP